MPASLERFPGAVVLAAILLVTSSSLLAHGDDQVLIDALTAELAKTPDADLFIRRGELFRHQHEWTRALADYAAAERLDPGIATIDFFRARALLEAGTPRAALPVLQRYLDKVPDEAEAWFLRGDIQAALGQHADGAADYVEGIRRAPSPRPEHFLRRARFLARTPNADPADVVAALDEGIARIGPVISLVDYAITLDVERRNYAAALDRIETAMQHAPRREAWLVRRGDILVKAGRTPEAIASYRAALTAIDELPQRFRETVPVEKLARDARMSLDQLRSL